MYTKLKGMNRRNNKVVLNISCVFTNLHLYIWLMLNKQTHSNTHSQKPILKGNPYPMFEFIVNELDITN